jgi:hypothetical protein
MTPKLGGTLETLQVDLAGRQLRLVVERSGPATAPLWLLLPALSTVSSRAECNAFADAGGDRVWWLQQARMLQCPLQLVLAAEAPPRTRQEMEVLAQAADQFSVIPGRLGLHQEFGALLTRQLLKDGLSAG